MNRHKDKVDDFAYIFTLIVKTVNPRIDGDETFDIVKDFLTAYSEGESIEPEDAINYGYAILTTSKTLNIHRH